MADITDLLHILHDSPTTEIKIAQKKLLAEIVERKRIEERLGQVISRARCILWDARVAQKPEGAFEWDLWIHPSDVIRDLGMDFSPNESPGSVWARHLSAGGGDSDRLNEASYAALRNGAPVYKQEFCLRACNGAMHWMEEVVEVTRVQSGEWDMVGVVTDVTDRKQAENASREAKDAAEAATRAKSEFLAKMSHEIRTPINGVIGITDLVLDSKLSSEQREHLRMVKASADSLLRVIDDILDFSKVEAGKLTLDSVPFNLRGCLSDTMKILAVRAHEKNLELTCYVRPDVPNELSGDAGRLRQILVNLVGNAIKFTEKGEVAVEIRIDERSGDAALLHFSVTDTGIGIPADKQQLILEPFEQADSSTSRKYGGTGLGLAISTNLAKLMGGRLWSVSENGRGSIFHFTARFGTRETTQCLVMPVRAARLQGQRVLVVDDHAGSLGIIARMLCEWRVDCVGLQSGREALTELQRAAAAGTPFQVVLLDAQMPELSGFELARQIKLNPALACSLVLMLAAPALSAGVNRCQELGIPHYLMKPVGHADLLNVVLAGLGAPLPEPSDAASSGVALLAVSPRSLRVLLAEDNKINQVVAIGVLRKRGHTVVVANNGKEVLEHLARQRFDVVLMDVQMPEMGGFAATAAIRDSEHLTGRHIPIVAMTAHALKGDRERCLKSGMDAYLSKPLKPRELVHMIERLVPRDYAKLAAPGRNVFSGAPFQADSELGIADEIAAIFLKHYPQQLAEIEESLQRRDAAKLEFAAHSFKSAVGYFGAAEAVAALQRLESMGRKNELAGAEEIYIKISAYVAQLAQDVAAFKQVDCA